MKVYPQLKMVMRHGKRQVDFKRQSDSSFAFLVCILIASCVFTIALVEALK